jgi:DNA polymerase V
MKTDIRIYSYNDREKGELLPYFQTMVSCGFPSPADDYLEKKLSLDELLIMRPTSTFFVKAEGESMWPVIKSGDLLVIDRSLTAKNGDVILGLIDGEFSVKRFFKSELGISLMPENKKFKPININDEGRFEVWGVVIHIIHSLASRSV